MHVTTLLASSACSNGPRRVSRKFTALYAPCCTAFYRFPSWVTCILSWFTSCGFVLWLPRPWSNRVKLRYTRKSARLVVTVSVIYSICWIPVLVVYVFSSFSAQQLYSAVHTTSIVLVTLNSAINPVLYSLQSDRFRRHMLALLPFDCSTRQCRVSPAVMSKGNATSKA